MDAKAKPSERVQDEGRERFFDKELSGMRSWPIYRDEIRVKSESCFRSLKFFSKEVYLQSQKFISRLENWHVGSLDELSLVLKFEFVLLNDLR